MQRNGIREDQVTQVRGFCRSAAYGRRMIAGFLEPQNLADRAVLEQAGAACGGCGSGESGGEKWQTKVGEKQGENADQKSAEVKADPPGADAEKTAPAANEQEKGKQSRSSTT